MYRYTCHVCKGDCDAGELENGVCYDCRTQASEAEEKRRFRIRKELNIAMHARYTQQADGQLVMFHG